MSGCSSHLVSIPPGPQLVEALMSSPVIQGEDGTGGGAMPGGFDFGLDPNDDPELALVSLTKFAQHLYGRSRLDIGYPYSTAARGVYQHCTW